LLRYIEDLKKFVAIAGFKDAKITDLEQFFEKVRNTLAPHVEFQLFDARLIATFDHLFFAFLNALTAFKNGENISKSLAMEIMLFASGQRQIRKAMKLIGIKDGTQEIVVLVVGENAEKVNLALACIGNFANAKRDDSVLDLTEDKIEAIRRAFKISNGEIEAVIRDGDFKEAVKKLVIERVALLSTRR